MKKFFENFQVFGFYGRKVKLYSGDFGRGHPRTTPVNVVTFEIRKNRKNTLSYLQFSPSRKLAFFFSLTIVCFKCCASLKHKSLAYLINGAITIALLFPKDVDTTPGGGGAREPRRTKS